MNPVVESLARAAHLYTCREMCELVTEEMEGALPLRRRVWTGVHLMLCAGCRSYRRQLRLTVATLRETGTQAAAQSPEAPREMKDALAARLRAKKKM